LGKLFKKAFLQYPVQVDWLLATLLRPFAYVLRGYRRFGSARLPLTTRMFREVGIFPILHYYYEPLFNPWILPNSLEANRNLPGLDLNIAGQLSFLSTLDSAAELVEMHWEEPAKDVESFHLKNNFFETGDADFLYQILRKLKPRRVIEIGSGHSTKIVQLALDKNTAESGLTVTHRCIEPFENAWLAERDDIELIRTPVELLDIDWSTELSAGDLLFIDSSHMIRPQGDVLKEYLEILPQLASGVYVHIHDIFTPRGYPRAWQEEDVLFWNEQYLLEALLSGSKRYEVVAALNYLKQHHYERLYAVCPYLTPQTEPGSFYVKVR
jgi:predicted O-methyltransferase YrrM